MNWLFTRRERDIDDSFHRLQTSSAVSSGGVGRHHTCQSAFLMLLAAVVMKNGCSSRWTHIGCLAARVRLLLHDGASAGAARWQTGHGVVVVQRTSGRRGGGSGCSCCGRRGSSSSSTRPVRRRRAGWAEACATLAKCRSRRGSHHCTAVGAVVVAVARQIAGSVVGVVVRRQRRSAAVRAAWMLLDVVGLVLT